MKKYLLSVYLCCCCCCQQLAAQDCYSIQFSALNGTTINTQNSVNKRLIVVAFDAAHPVRSQLQALDSIYRNSNNSIQVIGIPVNDFSPAPSTVSLMGLLGDSLNVSFPIAAISQGKVGTAQHPLIRWLTTVSPKNHFNVTYSASGQLFVVAPNGLLYAVLDPQTPIGGAAMQHVLNNWPSE